MELREELEELMITHCNDFRIIKGCDVAEIYVSDFLDALLGKFKLLPIHDVSNVKITEWTSVKDSLPKFGDWCLWANNSGDCVVDYMVEDDKSSPHLRWKHWMYLPELPKK
jgi:hypothetical protein